MPNEQLPLNEAAFRAKFHDERVPVSGKRCVVTGGTTGLGRAIAMLLVAKGARVLIFGRHEKELGEALADIKSIGGGEIFGAVADSARSDDVARVFREADKYLGGVDILVNNAALKGDSILDTDVAEWEQIVAVNVLGYMYAAREAADRMKRDGGAGHILNIGSLSAEKRNAGSDIYVATKSAIRGWSDSLAKTLNQGKIRVSLIEPGLVGSDMVAENTPTPQQPAKIEKMEMLRAEELAFAALFVLEMPQRCDVSMLQIRPTAQKI